MKLILITLFALVVGLMVACGDGMYKGKGAITYQASGNMVTHFGNGGETHSNSGRVPSEPPDWWFKTGELKVEWECCFKFDFEPSGPLWTIKGVAKNNTDMDLSRIEIRFEFKDKDRIGLGEAYSIPISIDRNKTSHFRVNLQNPDWSINWADLKDLETIDVTGVIWH